MSHAMTVAIKPTLIFEIQLKVIAINKAISDVVATFNAVKFVPYFLNVAPTGQATVGTDSLMAF
jgi:hypothetical protein